MTRIVSSLFKYVVWFIAILLLLSYTSEMGLIERTAYIAAGVVGVDIVILVVELLFGLYKSAKRTGEKLSDRIQQRKLEQAEKRGAKRAAQEIKQAAKEKEKKERDQEERAAQAQKLKDETQRRVELEKELRRRDKQDAKRPALEQQPELPALTEGQVITLGGMADRGKDILEKLSTKAKQIIDESFSGEDE